MTESGPRVSDRSTRSNPPASAANAASRASTMVSVVTEVVEFCVEIDMVHVLGVIDSAVRQDRR